MRTPSGVDVANAASGASVTSAARAVFGVPFRPRTYLNLLYLLAAFPLGIAYLVVFSAGLSLGVGLTVVLVGVPILLATLGLALALGDLERRLARWMLGVDVSGRSLPESGEPWRRAGRTLFSTGTAGALLFLLGKFVVGTVAFSVAVAAFSTGVSMLFVPLYYDVPGLYVGVVTDRPMELHPALYFGWDQLLVGFETVLVVGAYRVTTLPQALAVAAIGLAICLIGLHVLNGIAWATGRAATLLLGPTFDLTEAFDSSEGDRTAGGDRPSKDDHATGGNTAAGGDRPTE